MAEVAAHLTDRVLPWLPVRQWVPSVPKRVALLACWIPAAWAARVDPADSLRVLAEPGDRMHVS